MLFVAGSVLAAVAARSLTASRPSFLLVCGAIFRLTLLFRPADLSDDVWRYLWDGHVARAGISPWAMAPDDPALASLAPSLRERVAHRDIRTVYPPAAEAVFRAAGASENPFLLKALFASADLAVVAMLAGAGLPGGLWAAALYAFHPLPITETAGQGHLDSLGVALLVAALLYVRRGGRAAGGVALALSALTKYVALAAVLPLARRGGWKTLAAAAVTAAALWAFAARSGVSPAGGIGQYATRWEFNSVAYPTMFAAMEKLSLPEKAKEAFLGWKARHHDPPWSSRIFPYFYSAFFARAVLGVLLAAILAAVAWRERDVWGAVLASIGALLLASPTLHPWYVLWALPFAAARREPAFLWLAGAVPFAYALIYPVRFLPPAAVYAIEYVPFAVLLGATGRRLWRASRLRRKRPAAREGSPT